MVYKKLYTYNRSIRLDSKCASCTAIQNLSKIKARKQRKLCPEDEVRLCTLYQEGEKTAELAKQFDIDQLTVQRTLARNQIPFRPKNEECRKYHTEEERIAGIKATKKLWNERSRESRLEKARTQGKWKLPKRLAKYGITFEEWKTILFQQNCLCPICGEVLTFDDRYPDTDHCHATGVVRGILHNRCNRLLACADDKIENLQRAIEYLKQFQE